MLSTIKYTGWLLILLLSTTSFQLATTDHSLPELTIRTGKDYALFFAVNEYDQMNDLQQPIQNARQLAAELKNNYGFTTEVVENPTTSEIEKKLKAYQDKFARNPNGTYQSDGQLLIFFSGHGVVENRVGFFMPKDANPRSVPRTAISYTYWREFINTIDCKHILVAIDACFSVTFDPSWRSKSSPNFRKRPGELSEGEKLLVNHDAHQARLFFTADADADETPDRSNFAKKFLEGLQSRGGKDGILTSSELFTHLELASPKPHRGDFGDDEPGSSFLFMLANPLENKNFDFASTTALEKDLQLWKTAKERHTIAAYQEYLRQMPNGEFKGIAIGRIQELERAARLRAEELRWEVAQELHTVAGYKTYLTEYTDGKYARTAHQRIKVLTTSSNTSTTTPHDDRMVFVKGGTFTMGCEKQRDGECGSNEKAHTVTVDDFYMSKYEITVEEYLFFANETKSNYPVWLDEGSDYNINSGNNDYYKKKGYSRQSLSLPIIGVSWDNAVAYCDWLSDKTGKKYRLPTEAEWEFAARGGNQTNGYKYAGSNNLNEVAWYSGNSESQTHVVGKKTKNEIGLYDMSGNVWEWCSDWYSSDYYKSSPQRNPKGADSGSYRVVRGGSWSDEPAYQRVAVRNNDTPSYWFHDIGFRILRAAG